MTTVPSAKDDTAATIPIDEATPLLASDHGNGKVVDGEPSNENGVVSNGHSNGHSTKSSGDDRPLPVTQIFLLCYARLVEPIAFFSIFPFIPKMVQETGNLSEADVGFYSGLIESLFSLTQMCFMVPWGRAADRVGRKPVLVFSLIGVSIASAIFGLSTTIWQMILFRCLAGVFAGTIVTVRAMISENSTPKTQARAFSLFAFMGNLGIFLGPLLGGVLAEPAKSMPKLFGNVQFFIDYPYALPTFVTGTIGATATITSALFVKETLKRKTDDGSPAEPPMSTRELLNSPGVGVVLFLYAYIMFIGLGWTAVVPVFLFTPPESGGYGFEPTQIAIFLGVAGLSQAAWTLLALPPLQHRFGTGNMLRATSALQPIQWVLYPLYNAFLRQHWNHAFWIALPITLITGSGLSMSYTFMQLALNDIAPSHATLGTLNAIALASTAGIRAVAPALFTSLYATGIKFQILDGYLVWVIILALSIVTAVVTWRYFPEKAEGRILD